jgi:hypothetical protein
MSADTEDIASPPTIPPAAPVRVRNMTEPGDSIVDDPPVLIQRLTLTDFRAFPAPTCFDLDGKNLLVYGENGAGKSSIFHALKGFFARTPCDLLEHKNVFANQSDSVCAVAVQFTNDASEITWTKSQHPAQFSPGHVQAAALRAAFLDYRALLDTNYRHGNNQVNLFKIAVEQLLRDYPVTIPGGTSTTIGELWDKVQENKPHRHTKEEIENINKACLDFNKEFAQASSALVQKINELLQSFGWQDVELRDFYSPGLTYNNARLKRDRNIDGQQLIPNLYFRKHRLEYPQMFLNEARLSALGLAIYLAGRLAYTPTATNDLKLLALDDVLIGLDHSNRLPVLDVLREKFEGWQVVLLTYDRNWFDLARSHLPEIDWKCIEVYEGDPAAMAPIPIVCPTIMKPPIPVVHPTQNRPARALLEKANKLLKTPYVEASANYARQAFELGLRAACELKKVKMPYRADPKKYQAQDFLEAIKKEFRDGTALAAIKKEIKDETALANWEAVIQQLETLCMPRKAGFLGADWKAAIQQLETLKNVVMNPYSHSNAPNIPRRDVEKAIQEVENFLGLVDPSSKKS